MDTRTTLIDYLARYAYQYSEENPFLLVSGAISPEYLDCKLALSQPGAMVSLGTAFFERLSNSVSAIGGLTMGADPIAMATSLVSWSLNPVRWFTIRKETKGHGQKKRIEGSLSHHEEVAIVDDVVTSGASTIKAIEACREFGALVTQVIVLVDRQEHNGMDNIRAVAGPLVSVEAICTNEVKARWLELQ